MKAAPQTLAEAMDVIRAMHTGLLAFRNPEFDMIAPGREGEFDDRVKGVLAHSAPVIKADRDAADHSAANESSHDWRFSSSYGGELCADCGAVKGTRRGGLPCCEPRATVPTTALPVVDPGPDSLEREIQAKADKAPRVTPQALQDEIVSEHYFTGADGVLGAYRSGGDVHPVGGTPSQATHQTLGFLTFCALVLRNGFTVHGVSACASPENFNTEIGRRIARENAEREIWPLLGFRLRDELIR